MNGNRVGHQVRRLRLEPAVAVVGLGYWGPNLVRVLIERSDVEVRWICDSDVSRLEHFGRRYPSVQLTQEVDEILDDPSVDGVLLATPVFTHYELARRCLEADKHTFVEKPLAPSTRPGRGTDRPLGGAWAFPHVRPHVPLQPTRPSRS